MTTRATHRTREHTAYKTAAKSRPRQLWAGLLLSAFVVPFLTACGNGNVKVYRVTAKVICDGQPAPYAFVILHPTSTDERLQKLRPNGHADKDGVIKFTTYQTDDGAPAGQYRVTVKAPGPPPNQRLEDMSDEAARSAADRLGGRYQNPETSGLTLEVSSSGELPLIRVTAAAPR